MATLTQERLRSVLDYDKNSGMFTNRVRRANRAAGEAAGCTNALGYIKISVDGKQYLGHRLAWLYVYDEMPDQIDHINGSRSDNRIANLRPCNDLLNHQNLRKAHGDSKTGLLGTQPIPSGRYRARIMVSGVVKHIGCYDTKEEAHAAYVREKARLHQFSTLSS
ncbi:HNH endonuclease signature motif containing protein [Stutzerimonas kunmingensis]|uniref:HNH endonuclease signature motif containing protein n=1 Tax=Stutzerimonas kunmingensis TaxID=1211807 RepID=UPI0035B2C71B